MRHVVGKWIYNKNKIKICRKILFQEEINRGKKNNKVKARKMFRDIHVCKDEKLLFVAIKRQGSKLNIKWSFLLFYAAIYHCHRLMII